MIYADWREFAKGVHVRLKCGCEGFIEEVVPHSAEEGERGFMMVYTVMGCISRISQEKAYRAGYGPYRNMFNDRLSDQAMPAAYVSPPKWFIDLEIGPFRGPDKTEAKYTTECSHCGRDGCLFVIDVHAPSLGKRLSPNVPLRPDGYDLSSSDLDGVEVESEIVRCIGCSWNYELAELSIEKRKVMFQRPFDSHTFVPDLPEVQKGEPS